LRSVRTNNVAPISSTSDRAICAVTSEGSRRSRGVPVRASSLSAGAGPAAVDCSAGASPKSSAVAVATAVVKPITRQFGVRSKTSGGPPGEIMPTRRWPPSVASTMPPAAPARARVPLSTSS
jgi:hypothetical protein